MDGKEIFRLTQAIQPARIEWKMSFLARISLRLLEYSSMKLAISGFASFLLVAPIAAYPSPWRNQDDRSWIGKTIIMKRYGVQIYRTNDDRIDVVVGTLNRTDYVVVGEKEGRIWIRQDGVEGWLSKEDAALPEDGVEFFSKQLQQNPNDTTLYAKRSKCYELKGNMEAAIKDYDQAIRVAPGASSWWNNRANLYQKSKDYDRALEDYNKALALSPTSFIPLGNRGNAYYHKHEYERAITDYNDSIQQNPKYVNAHANRGNAYRELREFDKALQNYEQALRIDPKYSYAHVGLATLWIMQHRYDKAEEEVAAAIRLDRRSALAYLARQSPARAERVSPGHRRLRSFGLAGAEILPGRAERGNARREFKQYELALRDYDEALKIEPKSVTALIGKSLLLAACPDENCRSGTKALELAQQACELTKNKVPGALEALAAAHAEMQQFDEAIQAQRKVLEITWYAKEKGDEVKSRLALYESKKPYRLE